MQTFKNTNHKRDRQCTNVIACQAEAAPGPEWVACDESILFGLSPLWMQAGVRYFGRL